MTSPPLITIIIAVFNGAKTLQQCIDSVAKQTYPNKELIIIDGGSKDGTVDLLEANNNQISYWVSEPDRGIYNAWNKGLDKAGGEWVCFLGADDFFLNISVLEKMSEQLVKLPIEIAVAYGQVELLTFEGASLYAVGEAWGKVKKQFKHKMTLPHQGVMHRSRLFEQHGEFDESFRIVGDYEFLLRELKDRDAVFIPDMILTGMRQGGVSSKPEQSLKILYEIRRAQVKHGQFIPGLTWIMALFRVYIRVLLWRVLGESLTRKLLDLGRRMIGLPAYWTKT